MTADRIAAIASCITALSFLVAAIRGHSTSAQIRHEVREVYSRFQAFDPVPVVATIEVKAIAGERVISDKIRVSSDDAISPPNKGPKR